MFKPAHAGGIGKVIPVNPLDAAELPSPANASFAFFAATLFHLKNSTNALNFLSVPPTPLNAFGKAIPHFASHSK